VYPPVLYDGALHVDGGVLDNVPVASLLAEEGPLIAVSLNVGNEPAMTGPGGSPRVPSIADTLMRTMTIGSGRASVALLAQANLVIQPNVHDVGFLEFHQIDRAREAGRIATRAALPQIMALARS
jgi:predicted acylesterase/phospholipase RssA